MTEEVRENAFRTTASYLLAVIILPVLILWAQDNPLFTGFGNAEPWVYFGFFRNLAEFKRNAVDLVAGSHLSWILPGAAVHSLLPPVPATILLHLFVHSLGTVSLFLILKWSAGIRRAFLATMLFSLTPWLWRVTGSDDANGIAIAYCLLAIALLTRAALIRTRSWTLAFAGMTAAAFVFCESQWMAVAVLFPLYYLGAMRSRPAASPKSLAIEASWFGAGFGIVTVGFCIVNYFLDGHAFFFGASAAIALRAITSQGAAPWQFGLWSANGPSPWLAVPMAAAIVAAWSLFTLRHRPGKEFGPVGLFSSAYLTALGLFAFLQFRGHSMLGDPARSAILLPFAFLVIGSGLWAGLEALPIRSYAVLCAIAALAVSESWLTPTIYFLDPLPLVLWIAAALLIRMLLVNATADSLLYGVASVSIATAIGVGATYSFAAPHAFRDHTALIAQARQRIDSARNHSPLQFWFDRKESVFSDSIALRASFLQTGDVQDRGIGVPPCNSEFKSSSLIVAILTTPGTPQALSDCWSSRGLHAEPLGTYPFERATRSFRLALLRIAPVPGAWQPVTAEFDQSGHGTLQDVGTSTSLPLQYWVEQEQGIANPSTGGSRLRAPAFYPPMTAALPGRYRFALRYTPFSGSIRLAANTTGSTLSGTGVRRGDDFEVECWVDLTANQEFRLTLSSEGAPASLTLHSLTAIRVLPAK